MKEFGTCRFCGQKVMTSVSDSCTQEEIDEMVAMFNEFNAVIEAYLQG